MVIVNKMTSVARRVWHGPGRIIIIVLLVLVGLDVFNRLMNLTLYNPAFAVPVFAWAEKHHIMQPLLGLHDLLATKRRGDYPVLTIPELQSFSDDLPRAAVIGTVTTKVHNEGDGDWHVNVTDAKGHTQVLEFVPEVPLKLPDVGQRIKVWGIVRYDIGHRWWEIHPVFGWTPEG